MKFHLFVSMCFGPPAINYRRAPVAFLLFLCFFFCIPARGAEAGARGKPAPQEFLFETEPPGADIRISLNKGETFESTGTTGTLLHVNLDRLCRADTVMIEFRKVDFERAVNQVNGEYFRHHSRYPEVGKIRLTSVFREIVFRTSPPKARVSIEAYSNPQSFMYLCSSGKVCMLDTSGFAAGKDYTLLIQHGLYRDFKGTLSPRSLVAGKTNYYPFDMPAAELTPAIPVISPLYVWAEDNRLQAMTMASLGAILMVYCIFGIVLPRRAREKEKEARLARWEEIAGRVNREDPMCGLRLGAYRIIDKVGEGGMAAVYRAVPESSLREDEAVAIKIMQPHFNDDPHYARRFRREMKIQSGLNHPGILHIMDYGDKDGLLYITMEYIRGRTLRALIPEKGFSLKEFQGIFMQILKGAHYAHLKGIIHRDLKPDNIMVRDLGNVVIMDFGLARGENFSAITVSGTAFGTPAYMAPEQIKEGEQNAKVDQYSLGIIAYQMLTGEVPFWDKVTAHILFKHLSEEPRPLRELRHDLPLAVERIVLRMLEKEPEKRFTDLREVEDAFLHALESGHSVDRGEGGKFTGT
jgi:hypothetical protein